MRSRSKIVSSMLMLAMASLACGGLLGPADSKSGGTSSAGAGSPIDTQVNLDAKTAATALITPAGGSLSATAADGTAFTLTLPAGALEKDAQITLTPASSIDGLPFSGGLVGALQMAPEGLRLLQAATLTIESPKTVAAEGFQTVAFGYHQGGEGMYLNPAAISGNVMTLEVWHFSGAGAAQGTPAEVNAQQEQHVPQNAEDAFTQEMQQFEGRERQAELLKGQAGQEPDPEFGEKTIAAIKQGFKDFLEPQLAIALQDCEKAPAILARALGALRQMELMGGGKYFQAEMDQVYATIDQVKAKCSRGYKAEWHDQGTDWTGVVCSLDQPFTITVLTSGSPRLEMPFEFVPAGPTAGTVNFNVTKLAVNWRGSGAYTVKGTGNNDLSLVGTVAATYTSSGQTGPYSVPFNVPLTPLTSSECSKP